MSFISLNNNLCSAQKHLSGDSKLLYKQRYFVCGINKEHCILLVIK